MSIIFKRPRFRKNPDPDASKGRLAVGWRIQDWTLVYYEPITTADDDANPHKFDKFDNEGAAELGLFRFDNPTGPPAYREPMKGEVAWLPHFDPARFTSRIGRERDLMQRRFLNDAYAYCLETDPEKEAALLKRLTDDKHRMWASWFEEAQKWKRAGVKKRAVRRSGGNGGEEGEAPGGVSGPRNPGPGPKGDLNPDLDSDDEGYDDDGEEGAVPMPPPAIPKRKHGGTGAKGGGSGGKKPRRSTTGDGIFVSGPSPSPSPGEMMGGGLGSRGANGAGTIYGGSSSGYDSDHDHPWDSNHTTPRPSPTPDPAARGGPRGPNGLDGGGGAGAVYPTPNSTLAQRHSYPPQTPNGTLGSGRNGTAPPRPNGRPNGPFVPGSPQLADEASANDDDRGAAVAAYNGEGVDEDEATRRAMRASLAPPDESQHPDIRQAMRASMEPGVNGGRQVNGGGLANGGGQTNNSGGLVNGTGQAQANGSGQANSGGHANDDGQTNGGAQAAQANGGGQTTGGGHANDGGQTNGVGQGNGGGQTNGGSGLPDGVQRSTEGGEDEDEAYGGA